MLASWKSRTGAGLAIARDDEREHGVPDGDEDVRAHYLSLGSTSFVSVYRYFEYR